MSTKLFHPVARLLQKNVLHAGVKKPSPAYEAENIRPAAPQIFSDYTKYYNT